MLNSTEFSTHASPSQETRSREAYIQEAWARGRLRWKLDAHQRRIYDRYRQWEERPHQLSEAGEMRRIYVLDISRRWGKTFLCLIIKFEDCIRAPNTTHTYACAFAKDIAEIVLPLSDDICEDAPEGIGPSFRSSKEGRSMGLFFPNGSQLRLVGIDVNPRGLRGRRSDGFVVSEAGHVKGLEKTVKNVVYPQFQRIPHARMILESNAPEDPEHDFDKVFIPDAQKRGAYEFQTIDDNDALPADEKEEFIAAAGGRGSPTCDREYYGLRIRNIENTVIPEFDITRHVVPVTVPQYAHCYIYADPGTRDKYALVFAYWDFFRAKLVVQRSWAKTNAGLREVAEQVRAAKEELWSRWDDDKAEFVPALMYWDGAKLCPNPYRSASDHDARAILELNREHNIKFIAADKKHAKADTQAGSARRIPEAKLLALRQAFRDDAIEISDQDVTLGERGALPLQLQKGKWNDARTDFERSPLLGHLDCVMALSYLWNGLQRNLNPNKPALIGGEENVFFPPGWEKPKAQIVKKLNLAFGKGSNRTRRPW